MRFVTARNNLKQRRLHGEHVILLQFSHNLARLLKVDPAAGNIYIRVFSSIVLCYEIFSSVLVTNIIAHEAQVEIARSLSTMSETAGKFANVQVLENPATSNHEYMKMRL